MKMKLVRINLYLVVIVLVGIANFPLDCYGAKFLRNDPGGDSVKGVDHAALAALVNEADLVPLPKTLTEEEGNDEVLPGSVALEVDPVKIPQGEVETESGKVAEAAQEAGNEAAKEVEEVKLPEAAVPEAEAAKVQEAVAVPEIESQTAPVLHEVVHGPVAPAPSLVDVVLSATGGTKTPSPGELKSSCQFVTLDSIQDTMLKMLGNPTELFSGRDYACTILSLIRHTKSNSLSVSHLESGIENVKSDLESLYQDVSQHSSRFVSVEKLFNETTAEEFEEISVLRQKLYHFILRGSKEGQAPLLSAIDKQALQISALTSALDALKSQGAAFTSDLTALKTKGYSWFQHTQGLQTMLNELASRASKLELEIVSRITEIVQELNEIEVTLKAEVGQEVTRASKQELEIKAQISEQASEVLTSLQNLELQLNTQKTENHKIISQELHENMTRIHAGLNHQIAKGFEISKGNQEQLEKLIESQSERLDSVESDLSAKLAKEVSRATKAEMGLSETLLHQSTLARVTEGSLKNSLDSEISRAIQMETNLQKSFSETKDKLRLMEKDLKIQIDVEGLRAKGTESQLSTIIMAEAERAKSAEIELSAQLHANVSRLISDLMSEYNRAKSAEDKLERKISDEISRAINTESNLLANINDELKRASESEQELQVSLTNDGIWLRKLANDLDTKLKNVDTRTDAVETDFVTKLTEQSNKIQLVQDNLQSALNEGVKRSETIKLSLEEAIHEAVKRSKEFESKVLSTISTEVARGENFAKDLQANLTDEISRTKLVESELKLNLRNNVTDLGDKIDMVLRLIDAQTVTVEETFVEVAKNFTSHLLTLAGQMDKKLEGSNSTVEKRFKKLDDEFKKCCNSGWWRSPSTSTSTSTSSSGSGVFNRVFGLFSRNRTKTAKISSSNNSSTSLKEGRRVDDGADLEMDLSGEIVGGLNLTRTLLEHDVDELAALEGKAHVDELSTVDGKAHVDELSTLDGKANVDESSTVDGKARIDELKELLTREHTSSGRTMPVYVRRSKSKVRKTYG